MALNGEMRKERKRKCQSLHFAFIFVEEKRKLRKLNKQGQYSTFGINIHSC